MSVLTLTRATRFGTTDGAVIPSLLDPREVEAQEVPRFKDNAEGRQVIKDLHIPTTQELSSSLVLAVNLGPLVLSSRALCPLQRMGNLCLSGQPWLLESCPYIKQIKIHVLQASTHWSR